MEKDDFNFIAGILIAEDDAADADDDGAAAREIERMAETLATLQSPIRVVDFRRREWCAIIAMIIICCRCRRRRLN